MTRSPGPSRSFARRRGPLSVAVASLTLAACGGDAGQAVQDQAEKRTTNEINRIVDSAGKTGREEALRKIDRLERAAKGSGPIENAADRARTELKRRSQ